MKKLSFHMKGKTQWSALLTILLLVSIATVGVVTASPGLSVTLSTDKKFYYLREKVTVSGNLSLDGSLAPDGLVALQINDPLNSPYLFRTLPTGTTPPQDWEVKVIDMIPCDDEYNPKNKFKPGEEFYVNVTARNDDPMSSHDVWLTVSVCDGNQCPIGVASPVFSSISPGGSLRRYPHIPIPLWAYIGNATVYANLYTDFPKIKGAPCSLEASTTFQIINVETSSSGVQGGETTQTNGSYSTTFTLSPEPDIGNYSVYVTAIKIGVPESVFKSTSFEVKSSSYPPQASFIYTPPKPYVKGTVYFDASASTPEGGVIMNYTWNFGDNTPIVTETDPFTTHKYSQIGTYTVTLNVTDSEGLWCTTSKPVKIWPPDPPTAAFTWNPLEPSVNQTVTFDATSSIPGRNGSGWVSIVSYAWDFGDGNQTTVSTSTITHVYKTNNTYVVSLTVTDAQGLSDLTWDTINVTMPSGLKYDFNGNGVVDIGDVRRVARAYGSAAVDDPETPWDETQYWDPVVDVSPEGGDGRISISDVRLVAKHYMETG